MTLEKHTESSIFGNVKVYVRVLKQMTLEPGWVDGVEGDKLEAELRGVLYVGSQAKDKDSLQLEKTWPSSPQPLRTEKEAHALPAS